MAGVNKVIILGALGRDPEVKYTASGMAVCQLSIATSYKPRDKDEVTEWHRVVLFDKRAEIAGKYLAKGRKAYIEGMLRTRKYEKDGVDHYSTEIVADNLVLIDKPPTRTDDDGEPRIKTPKSDTGFDDMDDDIPF